MITLQAIGVEYSAKPLFSGVSAVINPSDRIALVGKNGAGKSTLLKIIAGLQTATTGQVAASDGTTIGYLPQQMKISDETSIIEEVRKVFASQLALEQESERLSLELASREDYDSEEYHKLIDRLTLVNERIEMEKSSNMEAEIERTLIGLGFNREDFPRPTAELSGGWRMRIELAKLLLRRPDVLLLDEPTNHLDIESIQWLEQFLVAKAKAVVVVSHDRAFIDKVTNRTIEISCGRIYDYKTNYSHFVELRRERIEQQRRAYENQQKEIADITDFIERFRYKATKAVQVQSRIKQLEKIVPIEIDEVDNSHLNLKFPPAPRSGDYPVIIEDVGKAYGNHQVFDKANFRIKRGEKVAFVGRNGEGKSTLVKCIMGEIPFTGDLTIGHNVKIGYFAQNQAQLLDQDITVFDTIDRVAVGDIRTKIRDILGAFMFGGEASDKMVKVLSGGEKTRLAMIRLLLEPVNLLILDEPTNHLDMKTKDVLKEAIKAFDGTVIVVSHDREFLDGLVEKVYEFGGGRVIENIGGIYDFLNRKRMSNLNELEYRSTSVDEVKPAIDEEKQQRKLSYAEQKEHEKLLKRALKAIKDAELLVEKLDEEKAELEQKLSEGQSDASLLDRYAQVQKQSEEAMLAWEEAQMEYENLNS
ncbi:MAG: ABC-F family ATP-binding cassette domain-containing protein [Muribaculaceae bacterium]|nr:ABC-F family ATP-binding cassette domain-containing protein [Muribaculaceae bacterium]MBQ5696978.1 ABC-F family ATP-binding cassette domain-containing protein [Muribaculaceae bacterium]MBQ5722562.1 ABC-F family ATP-binding cassette domain-containing protein [Muribaculaceae bacterium]